MTDGFGFDRCEISAKILAEWTRNRRDIDGGEVERLAIKAVEYAVELGRAWGEIGGAPSLPAGGDVWGQLNERVANLVVAARYERFVQYRYIPPAKLTPMMIAAVFLEIRGAIAIDFRTAGRYSGMALSPGPCIDGVHDMREVVPDVFAAKCRGSSRKIGWDDLFGLPRLEEGGDDDLDLKYDIDFLRRVVLAVAEEGAVEVEVEE